MDYSTCKKCGSLSYDILTGCVSILDVVTDVLVMIQFYNKGRYTFFMTSLIILIVAQLSYILSFWGRHHVRRQPLLSIALFFLLIPFAPCISFFFYIIADDKRYKLLIKNTFCLNKLICNNPYTTYVDDNQTQLQQWMQMKLYKHIGFIIESLFEAFPQSILQLVSIIYYNDHIQILSIISILLSMISVCSKSFAFSIAVSINTKTIIFTFLCCATDFISIFFTVSVIFYGLGHPELGEPFNNIQILFFYKIIICVIPVTLIGSIGINLYSTSHYISYSINNHNSLLHIISYCITMTLFIQLIWIVLFILAVMCFEVGCLLWFVILFTEIGLNHRLSNSCKHARRFYLKLIKWIKNGKSVKCDKTKFRLNKNSHKKIRVFAINKVLLISATQISSLKTQWHKNKKDDKLLKFIEKYKQTNENLANIDKTLHWIDFRKNTDNPNLSYFFHNFWYTLYGKLWIKYRSQLGGDTRNARMKHRIGFIVSSIMTFILLPIYFISRLLNIFFPLIVVLYLYLYYDIIFWFNYVDEFQVIAFMVYITFLFLSFCMLFFSGILDEQYYGWHIMPISNKLYAPKSHSICDLKFDEILHYYDTIVFVPIINKMINEKFHNDIGEIIMNYYHQIIIHNLDEESFESYEIPLSNTTTTATTTNNYDCDLDHDMIFGEDDDDERKEETNSLLPITRITTDSHH